MKRNLLSQGILSMDRVREVLRLHELGLSQRGIHRATGVARSTLQEYLRMSALHGISYEKALSLSDGDLRSLFRKKVPGRTRLQIADPDFDSIHKELRSRKGMTLELLWHEWNETSGGGYSYATFCRRFKEHLRIHSVVMRQEYTPGEKLLSDYSGATLSYRDADGNEHAVEIFVAVLGASNYTYAEATEDQKVVHWVNSHIRALQYFGGVPEALYIDNLKSGVTRSHRYEPIVNRTFAEFAAHYGTAVFPVRARKPQDKAKVEKAVQMVGRRILAPLRNVLFRSVAEINSAIKPLLEELNARTMKDYGVSRRELFESLEMQALRQLPSLPFICATWKKARISLDYHVQVGHHYYSVPYYHVKKEVWVKSTEKLVEIFLENERIASHIRSNVRYRFSTLESHLPPAHKAVKSWTAENFLQWAHTVGPSTERLVQTILNAPRYREQSYRSILGIQRLEKKYGRELTEKAACTACARKHHSQRALRLILEKYHSASSPRENDAPSVLTHKNVRGAEYYH